MHFDIIKALSNSDFPFSISLKQQMDCFYLRKLPVQLPVFVSGFVFRTQRVNPNTDSSAPINITMTMLSWS